MSSGMEANTEQSPQRWREDLNINVVLQKDAEDAVDRICE